ncbi:DUF3892 domain-containing protein [Chitinophaga sp.]|uniref:DUF3892 domain-containing protein n=1 Tax=Chitinophaga sp. TaxID=1869181 RepID=UPI0031D898A7
MASHQVICISSHPIEHGYYGITHLGGYGWKLTKIQVIQAIESGAESFYTLVGGNRTEIGIVNAPAGKYLRTYADDQWNDNLLELPECL